jgi:hypothetical protein
MAHVALNQLAARKRRSLDNAPIAGIGMGEGRDLRELHYWGSRPVLGHLPFRHMSVLHSAVVTVLMGIHPSRPTAERHQSQPLSVSSWIALRSSPTSVGNSVVS